MVMNISNIFVKYIKLREKLNQAKIYKIVDNTNENKYIGSTCKTLKGRLLKHKSNYKIFLKGNYCNVSSFDILKNNDYHIELLENCNIKTKKELLQREQYFIRNNECVNKYIPGRSLREYREDNKDKIKLYRNNNKDKIKESSKNYYIVNKDKINEKFDCECGGKYIKTHKSRHIKSLKHQEFIQRTLT